MKRSEVQYRRGGGDRVFMEKIYFIYFFLMPPHVLMNFRGFHPGCGDSVADF